jgi:hypothetical protein
MDCHPVMMALLIACMSYVGILVAMAARHAAGAW